MMKILLRALIKFDDGLARVEAGVLILFVAAMTVVVFLQVFYRYVLTEPLHWSEELARYLFVWLSMFGASLAVQKRGHFGFDILFQAFSQRIRWYMRLSIHLLMEAVILVILVQGVTLVQKTMPQESPAMGISMGWAYACLPVGAALMALHLFVLLLRDATDE